MASFRDLASRHQAADPRGRHRRGRRAAQRSRAPSCSTCASPTSTSRAPSPARCTSPAGTLETQHRGPGAGPRHAADRPLRRRHPLGLRGQDARASSATPTSSRWRAASTSGRTRAATGRCPRTLTPEQRNRYQRHLLLPEVDVEGQLKLLDAKVLLLGAGGLGSPGCAVPRRRRRRHDRHHRHGRRRRVEPAAPDPAQHRPHRRPQGRLGEEDAHAAQPRRQRRHLRRAPRRRQRAATSSTATTSSSTAPTTSRPGSS